MSGPYVYKPIAPVRYAADFQNTPYYVHTPRTGTPFIPDSALYPNSPYSNPNSLPASPNRPNAPLPGPNPPNRYAFPTVDYESDYGTPWERYQRERRPSWHGANDQWLQAPPTYALGAGFQRRHSFGASGYPPPPQDHRGSLSTFYINPWINGEAPRADFYFDLALPSFTPLRIYASGQSDLLPHDELIQPATHPPITLLRIICDVFPQWPMELRLDPYVTGVYNSPPITLSDVLVAVHRNMHKQITHADWDKLSRQQEIEVARAFTRRCHAHPHAAEQERVKGVKRVDYLLGKTRLAGLINLGRSDGWEVMKLVVT